MQLSLGWTVAPQIEALEPECWGVSWEVGAYEYPQAPDIKRKMEEELKPQ